MTATEELRHLLDERGVEYDGKTYEGVTFWNDDTNMAVASEDYDGKLWVSQSLTPAQAVEATLGMGECRNLIAHTQGQMPMLHCEECGCTTTLNVPSGGAGYIGETAMVWPLYCANCRRKVRA